jgi:hypothetical protein
MLLPPHYERLTNYCGSNGKNRETKQPEPKCIASRHGASQIHHPAVLFAGGTCSRPFGLLRRSFAMQPQIMATRRGKKAINHDSLPVIGAIRYVCTEMNQSADVTLDG